MSYTPTTWATGDIVTAEKLNNMESGISAASASGGGLLVTMTVSQSGGEWTVSNVSESVMDIYSAASEGTPVFADIVGFTPSTAHMIVPLAFYYSYADEYAVSFFPRYEEIIDGAYTAIHYEIGGYIESGTEEWYVSAESTNG